MEDKTIQNMFSLEIKHYKKIRNLSISLSTLSLALTGFFLTSYTFDDQNPIKLVFATGIATASIVFVHEAKSNQDKIKKVNEKIESIRKDSTSKSKLKVIK